MAKSKKKSEPEYYRSRINSRVLNYNTYVMKGGEKFLYMLLLFLGGGAVSMVFYSGLFMVDGKATLATYISNVVIFCIVGVIATVVLMPTIRKALLKKRQAVLRNQFREFLVSVSNSMAGGMNVSTAVESSMQDLAAQFSADAYIVREVSELVGCMENNIPLEEAMVDFGARSGVDDIKNFAIVFSTCLRTFGNLKDVIRRTTDIISEKTAINAEIETTLTSNKLQMYVMNAIPILIVIIMRSMSSDFNQSFGSPLGVIASTVSIGLFVAAFVVGQKIMDIKG